MLDALLLLYPNPKTELIAANPFELLVATILSAQCTDVRVNIVTPALFKRFPTPEAMAEGTLEEIKQYIKSINFFPTKAKNIKAMARILVEEHHSEVTQTSEALESLPGVGRKTANVMRANAFNIPAIGVDTHVFRVANRLGWVKAKTPEQTEQGLMKVISKTLWIRAHHLLVLHGRRMCKARMPLCSACPVRKFCVYGQKTLNGLSTLSVPHA